MQLVVWSVTVEGASDECERGRRTETNCLVLDLSERSAFAQLDNH